MLGHWPEVAHILSFPQGLKIKLILTLQAAVSEILAKFQNCHISAWIPEVAHILSFYPRGWKLSLYFLYGQRFPRYRPIFKIAIFGHETWQVAKVTEIAHIHSTPTLGGRNSAHFCSMGSSFRDTG